MLDLAAIAPAATRAYAPRVDLAPAEATPQPGTTAAPGAVTSTQDNFSTLLGNLIHDVNTKQTAASDAVSRLQTGGNTTLHQAVLAMEEANISFQLMVEVRNKLLESYQELMRLQV